MDQADIARRQERILLERQAGHESGIHVTLIGGGLVTLQYLDNAELQQLYAVIREFCQLYGSGRMCFLQAVEVKCRLNVNVSRASDPTPAAGKYTFGAIKTAIKELLRHRKCPFEVA